MSIQPSLWESMGPLTPVRSSSVRFVERLVRGAPWLFVHNDITGQHVRVSELARQVVQKLDGIQTIESLAVSVVPDVDSVEQEALAISLLTLAQLGMVNLGAEISDHLVQQRAVQIGKQHKRLWHNPLAIRVPIFDPDPWLTRVHAITGAVMGQWLLWGFASIIVAAIGLATLNASEIGNELGALARTPQQWWQVIVVYPILKCLHEFAHGIVIKRFEGSCHEAGLTLLILMPVPYVDATDIWRFERRDQRILVSAAGMIAEGVCASLGLFIWITVEPGLLSDLAFAVALTGSLATLFFNANPLLKFDGYQILQDVLDMPNLASRSTRYLCYLSKRYLLSVTEARSPVTGQGERAWLFFYAVSAISYRWMITLGIAIYLTTRFPVIGGLLAVFALYKLAITPCVTLIRYLQTAAELEHNRIRAITVSTGVFSACLGLIFLLPVPAHTRAQGIVDVPNQAQLFAPQTGELAEIFVVPGENVEPGQRVLRIAAPDIETRAKVIQSELDVLASDYHAAMINDPAAVTSLQQAMADKQDELDQAGTALQSLVIVSEVAGKVSLSEQFMRIGSYISEGMVLGHVVNDQDLLIKAVVREGDIARVEDGVRAVSIRLAERFWDPFTGSMSYVTPAATRDLPSQALAAHITYGGIAVASSTEYGIKTVEPVFQLEFELPAGTRTVGIGGRAYVTLLHSPEPIGSRSWRALRRLVLEELAF